MNLDNHFTFVSIVGFLTIVITTLVKLFGFPDQIRQNHRRKSTKGLSSLFVIITFISYTIWSLYGSLRKDLVVVIGHGLGVVTSGIILLQILIYRKK